MVVVPLTCDQAGPEAIDGQAGAVELDAVASLVFATRVQVVVVSANAEGPDRGPTEQGGRERVPSQQVKRAVPKRPVEHVVRDQARRLGDRAPTLVLRVAVGAHARMLQ